MGKVSVIIPVYNAETYIRQCIESVLNQTYNHFEIILINDGSTDNSLSIIKEYSTKDSRVKVLSIENSGVSVARNIGIDTATGDYITFVDSDDWVEPDMLKYAVENINNTESDITIWSYYKNYYNKEIKCSFFPQTDRVFEENKEILYLKAIYGRYSKDIVTEGVSLGTTWCKLYRTDFIKNNMLKFNPQLIRAQDTIFSIYAFRYAKRISYFDKNLYHYRISNSSTTSGTRFISNTHQPFSSLLNEYKTFMKRNKLTEKLQVAFYARTIQVLLWHLDHYYFHDQYTKGILNRRKEIINLIKSEPYKSALVHVEKRLLPKKEKVMTILFKRKLILTFYFIIQIHNKVESYRKRRFE